MTPALDLEAARRRDVLEVDGAEARAQPDQGLDDLVGVWWCRARVGIEFSPAKFLNSARLALHHRQRGARADVAEAEHGGAVADDDHEAAGPGVAVGEGSSAAMARLTWATPGV